MLSVLMIGIFVAYSVLYVYQSFYWRKSTSYPNDNAHAESAAVRLLAPPKQEKVCAAAPSRSADVEGGHSDGHTISQAGEVSLFLFKLEKIKKSRCQLYAINHLKLSVYRLNMAEFMIMMIR